MSEKITLNMNSREIGYILKMLIIPIIVLVGIVWYTKQFDFFFVISFFAMLVPSAFFFCFLYYRWGIRVQTFSYLLIFPCLIVFFILGGYVFNGSPGVKNLYSNVEISCWKALKENVGAFSEFSSFSKKTNRQVKVLSKELIAEQAKLDDDSFRRTAILLQKVKEVLLYVKKEGLYCLEEMERQNSHLESYIINANFDEAEATLRRVVELDSKFKEVLVVKKQFGLDEDFSSIYQHAVWPSFFKKKLKALEAQIIQFSQGNLSLRALSQEEISISKINVFKSVLLNLESLGLLLFAFLGSFIPLVFTFRYKSSVPELGNDEMLKYENMRKALAKSK